MRWHEKLARNLRSVCEVEDDGYTGNAVTKGLHTLQSRDEPRVVKMKRGNNQKEDGPDFDASTR